jgi:predicted methyltransferase
MSRLVAGWLTAGLSRRNTVLIGVAALLAVLAGAGVYSQRSGSTIPTADIFAAIGAREGMTVCEIGAGDGALSLEVARVVGPTGHVYTSELGDERLSALRRAVEKSGLTNITVVEGAAAAANLPDAACDALFMRNVYHHFGDPAAMNASVAAALEPGAPLAVVDFRPNGTEASRPADRDEDGTHGVAADTVLGELQAAGFRPVRTQQGEGRWYMVVVENRR